MVATPAALVVPVFAAALLVASSLLATTLLVVVPIVAFLVSVVLLLPIIGLVGLPVASTATALVVPPVAALVTVGALLLASLVGLTFGFFAAVGGGLGSLGSIGAEFGGALRGGVGLGLVLPFLLGVLLRLFAWHCVSIKVGGV